MFRLTFFLTFSVLASLSSFATDVGNPMVSVFGFDRSLTGNIGLASRVSDASSVFFNPSRLRSKDGSNFFASSLNLGFGQMGLSGTTSETENTTTSLGGAPNFVIGMSRGRWSFALSYLTSSNFDFENELVKTEGTTSKTTLIDIDTRSLLLGATAGVQVTNSLSLGTSLFIERYVEDRNINVRQTDSASVSDFTSIESNHRTVANFFAVFGLGIDWTSWFSMALRLQSPGLALQGQVDHFSSSKGTNKSQSVNAEISDLFEGQQSTPMDIALGFNVALGRHEILFDTGVQLPVDFESIDGGATQPALTERIATKTTLRYGLGYQYNAMETWALHLGAQFSPSTIEDQVNDLAFQSTLDTSGGDLILISAGTSIRHNLAKLSLGGYLVTGTYKHLETVTGTSNVREFTRLQGGVTLSLQSQF